MTDVLDSPQQLLHDLRALRIWLTNPQHWTKGNFALTAEHYPLPPYAIRNIACGIEPDSIAKTCLVGAIMYTAKYEWEVKSALTETLYINVYEDIDYISEQLHITIDDMYPDMIPPAFPNSDMIMRFNDYEGITHSDILLVLDATIERLEATDD